MCGIAGYVGAAAPELLSAMLGTLRHRGPDDHGVHVEAGAGLGVARLAIIDLVTGRQPMANEDGSVRVAFNGEIYNFRELRRLLEDHGHAFRSRSDTEVIVHAWEEFGDACVERFRGMFALALWDGRRRRLLLARDRLGKKPLYYWQGPGLLLFASELPALLRHPAIAREVDWEALRHYLAFGYTPGDRSILARVAKLPPAHVGVFEDGRLALRRYWALPPGGGPAPHRGPLEETVRLVREELREAVRLRLESDVPLGVFLSGGIDSSAIVASMREVTGGRIATFSIGFGPDTLSFDELPYARMVARRFETEHHEEVLSPQVGDLLPAIVDHFGEPFADSSAVPTFAVARATASRVKVALTGIGGDETFGGYPRYLGLRLSEVYARVPSPLRTALSRSALALARESDASRNRADWVRRFAAGAGAPLPDRYIGWTRFFADADLESLATPDLRSRWSGDVAAARRAAFAARREGDVVDGAFRVDLGAYLPDDLLTMADRMSMAHSLELRAPFCDHRIVEMALGLPTAVKLPGLALKGLLKRAFAGVLPPAVLSRRKHGFMIPLDRWLRTELRDVMEDLLSAERVRARGLFVPAAVGALKEAHLRGERMHGDRLWTLMMAEMWMRRFLDRPPAGPVTRSPIEVLTDAPPLVTACTGEGGPLKPLVVTAVEEGRPPSRSGALDILVVSDVSPVVVHGGAERVLREQTRRLAALGHRVRIVSRCPAAPVPDAVEADGFTVAHFGVDRRSALRFVLTSILGARRAVAREIRHRRPEVLHLDQPLSALAALTVPAARRLPWVYTFHSPAPLEYRSRRGVAPLHPAGWVGRVAEALLRFAERRCLAHASRIRVLSQFAAGQLWDLYRVAIDRIAVVPGGVDTQRFRPAADRGAVRKELGLPADRALLLTLRNFEPRMGLDALLHAVDRLRARHPEVLLLVGGDGSLRVSLEALVRDLGLQDQVRFLGFVPDADLPRYYQAADLFVLPTRELEGFGLVTVEALACGTPVLGTPVGATPEILAPLSPALVFPAGDPETMARAIGRFLEERSRDAAAAQVLREACRRYAEERYDWRRSVETFEATLREAAAGGGAAAACRICGAPSTVVDLVYRRRTYRRCRRCGTGAVGRPPSAARLREIFELEYPGKYSHQEIRASRFAMFRAILGRLEAAGGRRRLLDIGCGRGYLLDEAARLGWRGVGADLAFEACAAARATASVPVVQADSAAVPARDGAADAVTLLDVLDMTAAPLRVLAEARRVLAPGGRLVVRVRNAAFHRPLVRWPVRVPLLASWCGGHAVLHVFAFTACGLRVAVERAGFEVLGVRNSPLTWVGPGGVEGTGARWLRAVLGGAARTLAAVSGGRWLLAPAIELDARKPAAGGTGRL